MIILSSSILPKGGEIIFDYLLDAFEGLKNRSFFLNFVRNFDISLSVPSGKGPPFYSLELWKVVFVAYTKRLSAFVTSIH